MLATIKSVRPRHFKTRTTQRNFVNIKNIISDEAKKSYGYVTQNELTANGTEALNDFFKRTEPLKNQGHLSEETIVKTYLSNHQSIDNLTHELNSANPYLECSTPELIIRNDTEVHLHDDSMLINDFVLILPLFAKDTQTFFFPDTNIFQPISIGSNFYYVKPSVDFKPYALKASKAVPPNAIASVFCPIGADTKPLVHSVPFDVHDENVLIQIASTGTTVQHIEDEIPNNTARKRPILVWIFEKKDI